MEKVYIAVVNQNHAPDVPHQDIPGTDLACIVKVRRDYDLSSHVVTDKDLQAAKLTDEELFDLAYPSISPEHFYICPIEQVISGDNREEYFPAEHTKTHKNRLYPMSDRLREFLDRYLPVRNSYYPDSPYLFPSRRWDKERKCWDEGGMITDQTIPSDYARMCIRLGIKTDPLCIRGPHAFRRNAITETMVASGGNIDLTAQIFGNSPETIRKAYLLDMDYNAKLVALNGCQRKGRMVI